MRNTITFILLIVSVILASDTTHTDLTPEERKLLISLDVKASLWELDEYEHQLVLSALKYQNKNNSQNKINLLKSLMIFKEIIDDSKRILMAYKNEFNDVVLRRKVKYSDSLFVKISESHFENIKF